MSHKAKSVEVCVKISATYVGESIDVEKLKKDVESNVIFFIEHKGLRMNEYTKTSPDNAELIRDVLEISIGEVVE